MKGLAVGLLCVRGPWLSLVHILGYPHIRWTGPSPEDIFQGKSLPTGRYGRLTNKPLSVFVVVVVVVVDVDVVVVDVVVVVVVVKLLVK